MATKTKTLRGRLFLALITITLAAGAVTARGKESPPAGSSAVQPASFSNTSGSDKQQSVRFGQHAVRIGDRVEQQLTLEMRLSTWLRQGNQIIEKRQMTVRSDQQRIITTTAVDAGRSSSVVVRYLSATKQVGSGEKSEFDDTKAIPSQPVTPTVQPVHGKTYLCTRESEDGKLRIATEDGKTPPKEEYEFVSQNMEMVGRANPLADLLGGQTITVGQTISLPPNTADRIFNLDERYGEVNRFELTMRKILTDSNSLCAEFLARVEAASTDSSQMRLQVEGPLVVQIDTCRAVRMALSGPIGLSESRGSYSTASHLLGTGQMKLRVASTYGIAPR
jgi:hypothetical protein